MMTYLELLAGLVLLVAGAELLVRGAARLARAIGIPPLVIGLTIVAVGTSAPEFAVSTFSAAAGQADLALGNVVGSNIFNVLFILGLSALLAPLIVAQQLVRFDVPLMVGVSILVFLLSADGAISRLDGILLVAAFVAYTAFQIRASRSESRLVQDEYAQEYGGIGDRSARVLALNLAWVAAGLALLVLGSRWLVDAAVSIARQFGLSELIIGLTIVAAGTSLPEVATSVIATLRGERDIAVGNVVGSNIFNLLGVLGFSGIVASEGIRVSAGALDFDIPVMIAVAIACLPIFFTGYRIVRWEGALFLGYYAAYTLYLLLNASEHDALPMFSGVMLWFVVPLTLITLVTLVVRQWRVASGAHS